MHKLLVATPINHINGLEKYLKTFSIVINKGNPTKNNIINYIAKVDAIYINPNKSKIFYGRNVLQYAKNLKVICTASTGTNHIDTEYAKNKNIKILSLTKQYSVINKISSTAELATTLSLMSIRHTFFAMNSVMNKQWDYERFIGRQFSSLKVGVIGFGRLGKIYTKNMLGLGFKVYVFDPFVKIRKMKNVTRCTNLKQIFDKCSLVSLHIHANSENLDLIDKKILKYAK